MAHPFAGKAESGRDRAKSLAKGYKIGGAIGKSATANVAKYASGGKTTSDTKVPGRASGGRLDTFARGGRAKGKGGKGHNTKINIVVAPKGPHPADGAAPPAPALGGGPLAGPPPGGLPPGPMGPPGPPGMPPGGPPGLPPGLGKPPGMMARGGAIKMKAGAESGEGRLEKARKYKARG